MKTKIVVLFMAIALMGCTVTEPTAQVEATRTHIPTVLPEATDVQPTETPLPTTTSMPENFDPIHPFRLMTDGGDYVELMNGTYTEIRTDIDAENNWSWVTPELSDGSDLTAQLGKCLRKLVMTNGYDGEVLAGHKLEAFFHSGIAKCGQENSANFIRVFLEGSFRLMIDFANRPTRMNELVGKTFSFKQTTKTLSDVETVKVAEMKVVDVELVKAGDWFAVCDYINDKASDEYEACTSKANGTLYRFFPKTGMQPGVREMFMVLCSAERDERVKSEENYNKIIVRLQ